MIDIDTAKLLTFISSPPLGKFVNPLADTLVRLAGGKTSLGQTRRKYKMVKHVFDLCPTPTTKVELRDLILTVPEEFTQFFKKGKIVSFLMYNKRGMKHKALAERFFFAFSMNPDLPLLKFKNTNISLNNLKSQINELACDTEGQSRPSTFVLDFNFLQDEKIIMFKLDCYKKTTQDTMSYKVATPQATLVYSINPAKIP